MRERSDVRAGPAEAGSGDAADAVEIRRVRTYPEYQECVRLQKETWGEAFTECVPAAILMVGQKIGGVTAGAFAPDGRLLGFVFGLTGLQDGRPVHWSDMLAVRPEARGRGIGRRLKLFQRACCLETGVELVYWTYDPLVARNAHLNLNRLGAEVHEYVQDMYGADTGSELHSGLGTDRFVVVWRLRSERVERALRDEPPAPPAGFESAPVVNAPDARGVPADGALPDAPAVGIAVPADIQAVKAAAPAVARRWRATTRRAFLHYLGRGYRVVAIVPGSAGHFVYALERGRP